MDVDPSILTANAPLVLGLAGLLGLLVGSFLNVLALRSLKEESILWPSSYCPACKHPLSILDNIPVISWLLLNAKCRYCKAPISWQYPAVELATAIIFAVITWMFLIHPIPYDSSHLTVFEGIASGLRYAHQSSNYANVLPISERLGLTGGFLLFACTLIAVTVTDFREKLIPHEITYPSMILGIIFSATVRHDLLGAMAGIGASYIIFDFLAFYGLKFYLMVHAKEDAEAKIATETEGKNVGEPAARSAANESVSDSASSAFQTEDGASTSLQGKVPAPVTLLNEIAEHREPETAPAAAGPLQNASDKSATNADNNPQETIASNSGEKTETPGDTTTGCAQESSPEAVEEPMEVMGGGDAVLSAVMSAYLGWQFLVVALCIGFFVGTLMGLALLFIEMKKANLLGESFKRGGLYALIGGVVMALMMTGLSVMTSNLAPQSFSTTEQQNVYAETLKTILLLASTGAAGGLLLGMVSVGTRVSKPFPFGPALAFGGFGAMFLIPWWLPFY